MKLDNLKQTTIRLDQQFRCVIRGRAATRGETLQSVVVDLLEQWEKDTRENGKSLTKPRGTKS